MPVYLARALSSPGLSSSVFARPNSAAALPRSAGHVLDIGVVNNMPDAALQATERQFLGLLDAAADGLAVRLTFYALPDVPRSESGRSHVDAYYSPIEELWDRRLDGLIVTGTEPRSPNLPDEPYWSSFTQLLGWADQNTYSAVWSCLAAHAAVLHLDGIERRRLMDKRFGLFPCDRVSDHLLTTGTPSRISMPHSRWNDLPEDQLIRCGYEILTTSAEAGVDAFAKARNSLFLFFQGHPEYDAKTLLLEYRRDIGRYLRGERETYPPAPRYFLDASVVQALQDLEEHAMGNRSEDLLALFPLALAERNLRNTWRPAATCIYGNWLSFLSARKLGRLDKLQSPNELHRGRAAVARRFAAGAD